MRSQSHAFWKLSPILPAIAIPIWYVIVSLQLISFVRVNNPCIVRQLLNRYSPYCACILGTYMCLLHAFALTPKTFLRRSPLFKLYLTGIGAMFKGNLYKTRLFP